MAWINGDYQRHQVGHPLILEVAAYFRQSAAWWSFAKHVDPTLFAMPPWAR
jgi:hypothetical protein